MNSENDLMQKLMISKQIMDKHNNMDRGNSRNINMNSEKFSSPMVESYEAPAAKYNIPQEFQQQPTQQTRSNGPIEDRIASSKLPDEIKQLMIENPIAQASLPGTTNVLSNEIIEGAQKLMGTTPKKQSQPQSNNTSGFDMNALKTMIRDTVRDTVRDVVREELSKSGMIVENEQKTNEQLTLKVGKHLFEGRVTKIKKIQ